MKTILVTLAAAALLGAYVMTPVATPAPEDHREAMFLKYLREF